MIDTTFEAAKRALSASRHAIEIAAKHCPDAPGLYAIYGTERAWHELGLEPTCADQPLYVGKAEDSLVRRDLHTHFATGRTGSSTLRRSLAALLREDLDLRAMPRNTSRPSHFANFALELDGDARLTYWMHDRLTIAFWEKLAGPELDHVETAVLSAWKPPLNIAKMGTNPRLRQARRIMADEARSWRIEGTATP